MGMSIWQLLIVLLIVLVLFGTKRLKSIGTDLGGAIKGFRDSMSDKKEEESGDPAAKLAHDDTTATQQAHKTAESEKTPR